jgi:hypothetical protein
MRKLGAFSRSERHLSHGICPRCFDRVAATLD